MAKNTVASKFLGTSSSSSKKKGKKVYKTKPKKNPERYSYSGTYGGWVHL